MVPQNGNVKHNLVLPETFSITQFVDQYTDPSLIQRLLLIGMKCPRYAVEAYTLALQKIKDNTLNVSLYKEASHFATLAKANFDSTLLKESETSNKDAFDIEWIVKAGSDFNEQLAKLNFDFSSIRFNSTVDSKTTDAILNLADLYILSGNLTEAIAILRRVESYRFEYQDYLKANSYMIKASLLSQDFRLILSLQSKFYKKCNTFHPNKAFIYSSFGISNMAIGNYKKAAEIFSSVEYSRENDFMGMFTEKDIAMYGIICALASLPKLAIRTTCMKSINFLHFLEHDIQLKKSLECFLKGELLEFSALIQDKMILLEIDTYLRNIYPDLLKSVQNNLIVMYIIPRTTADLSVMATSCLFSSSDSLILALEQLISKGKIFCRLNLFQHYLEIDCSKNMDLYAESNLIKSDFHPEIDFKLNSVKSQLSNRTKENISKKILFLSVQRDIDALKDFFL
ncbi:hypothetical protein BB560_007253 [Smittium megazygosporum]|uniref:26S proteasome regulatory subunit Rpn7 N-terminal domain-containing protein n=1 Tax=Smittium megazygosporum TaxID=133381 RepID=A0A2T9XXP1_9FUNG|nr:hypothetical protein BB560_007253 [Smittium megazygosporum]